MCHPWLSRHPFSQYSLTGSTWLMYGVRNSPGTRPTCYVSDDYDDYDSTAAGAGAGTRRRRRHGGGGSGEEVSVSLLYSRIKDRPNTPHPCVQEKKHHAKKREWVPDSADIQKYR